MQPPHEGRDPVASDAEYQTPFSGTAIPNASVVDWTRFENPFHTWSRDGPFPGSESRFGCSAGNCRIRDWSLAVGDATLRGAATPGLVIDHTWYVSPAPASQADCTAARFGSTFNAETSTCLTTFLAGAHEALDDGIGNDDGLCESGETCIAAPSVGPYQGEGALLPAGTYSNLGFTATLLAHETNGR